MEPRQYVAAPQRARLAALLPELATAAFLKGDSRAERMIRSGFRHGGLLGWGVEQARFSPEIFRQEVWEECVRGAFRPTGSAAGPEYIASIGLSQSSRAISRYRAKQRNDDVFELLVSDPVARDEILADEMLAERIVKIFRRVPRRMSAADLADVIRMLAQIAADDGDLSLEARGLRIGAATEWFDAPSIVHIGDNYLLERALPGRMLEELPPLLSEVAYSRVVTNWSRMLFTDGVLHLFLRRDTVRVSGDRVGAARWGGTRRAGPIATTFMRSLLLAAFALATSERANHRARASELLADGFGVTGLLDELTDFCIALVAESGRLRLKRPLMPTLFVQQSKDKSPLERKDIFQMLRQLTWIRDLGLSCGVADLASPWQAVARDSDA